MLGDRYAKLNFIGYCLKVKLFEFKLMKTFTAVVPKGRDTDLDVVYVAGF